MAAVLTEEEAKAEVEEVEMLQLRNLKTNNKPLKLKNDRFLPIYELII